MHSYALKSASIPQPVENNAEETSNKPRTTTDLLTNDMIEKLTDIVVQLEDSLVHQLQQHGELYASIEDLTLERDFYFEKLRTIEIMSSYCEEEPLAQEIQNILSKADLQ